MKSFFQNLSVKFKIYLSNAIFQTLVLTITSFSVIGIHSVGQDLSSVQKLYSESYGKSIQIGYLLIELNVISNKIHNSKNQKEIKSLESELKIKSSIIQKYLVEIENFLNIISFESSQNSSDGTKEALSINREVQLNFESLLSEMEATINDKNIESIGIANLNLLSSIQRFNSTLDGLILSYNVSLEEKNLSTIKLLFIGFIVSTLVSFAVSFFLGYLISKPLQKVESMATQLSGGDLSIQSTVNSSDEIGKLSIAFSLAAKNIKHLVQETQLTSSELLKTSDSVFSASNRVADGFGQQVAALEEISSSVTEVVDSIHQVSLTAADQSEETTKAIHEISELTNAIHEVSEKSILVDSSSHLMLEEAERGKQIVDNSVLKMTKIVESSKSITQIITVINDIASRTNLLSLNAAIEAARAGESGRGFSVVAEEISKLASNSQTATKQIEGLIKESIDRIEDGKNSIEQLVSSFTKVLENAKHSSFHIEQIKLLTHQQNLKSERVMNSMANLTNLANFVAEATEQQTASTKEIGFAVDQVNTVAQSSSNQIEEFANTTKRLSDLSEKLNGLISSFKTN